MLVSTFLEYRRVTYICTRVRTIPVNTISHICTRILGRIITIPIFKGGFSMDWGCTSEFEFSGNYGCDDDTKTTVKSNKERGDGDNDEKKAFQKQKDIVVFVQGFRSCLNSLKSGLCFIMRLPLSNAEKKDICQKNTSGKISQHNVFIISEEESCEKTKQSHQSARHFQSMKVGTVFKLLKKPIHLLLRMIECRHLSSLKNLINYTSSIAFSTNHAK